MAKKDGSVKKREKKRKGERKEREKNKKGWGKDTFFLKTALKCNGQLTYRYSGKRKKMKPHIKLFFSSPFLRLVTCFEEEKNDCHTPRRKKKKKKSCDYSVFHSVHFLFVFHHIPCMHM